MEREFHSWLKRQAVSSPSTGAILVGIGDDAAVIDGGNDSVVLATDIIADGTHFELSNHSLELIGRKSLAVNLSDLAAMAARPMAAVLTFLLPKNFGLPEAKQLYLGISELAAQFNMAIIGGDTNTWEGPLVVGATAIGQRNAHQSGWSIGGVRDGDAIVVSGSFGGSIHGRHLSFTPRIELALYLAKHYSINAATDVSDSLSLDLSAMADASNIGIDFDSAAIPISTELKTVDPDSALQHALSDGEDFELVLAVPQAEISRLMADDAVPCPLTVIGTATDQHDVLRTMGDGGSWKIVEPTGYVH